MELMVERVLTAVDLIPPGHVVSYGDVAELVGTSPRRVGAILGRHGATVPWWRVTNAKGELPSGILGRAAEHWREEGVETLPSGGGCRITRHRADLLELGQAFDLTTATEVPPSATG